VRCVMLAIVDQFYKFHRKVKTSFAFSKGHDIIPTRAASGGVVMPAIIETK